LGKIINIAIFIAVNINSIPSKEQFRRF